MVVLATFTSCSVAAADAGHGERDMPVWATTIEPQRRPAMAIANADKKPGGNSGALK